MEITPFITYIIIILPYTLDTKIHQTLIPIYSNLERRCNIVLRFCRYCCCSFAYCKDHALIIYDSNRFVAGNPRNRFILRIIWEDFQNCFRFLIQT